MNRALLIGINTYPQQPLAGCIPDVEAVRDYLVAKRGFAHADIVPLYDGRATKAAIVDALRHLIAASAPGDQLLCHYSGHGAQVPSQDVDEPDGLDEVLCPVDFDWTPDTTLTDNELHAIFATVGPGVSLTFVVDACHSGDLGRATGVRALKPPPDIKWRLANRQRVVRRLRDKTRSNVAIVSACASYETAADTSFGGQPNGAFTYYWLRALQAADGASATLKALVARAAGSLASYNMHPAVDGPPELLEAPFLASPPPDDQGLVAGASGEPEWRALSAEILRRADADPRFRARFEQAASGLASRRAIELVGRAFATPGSARRSVVCRTFVWGFQIEIGHDELQSFLSAADTINTIVMTLAPAGGPAAPWIEVIAGFIAAGLSGITALDAGAGIYISMLWFAPGVFVPTTVPVRALVGPEANHVAFSQALLRAASNLSLAPTL